MYFICYTTHMEVSHTWNRNFLSRNIIHLVCKIKRMQTGTWKISSSWVAFIVLKGVMHAPFEHKTCFAWPTSQALVLLRQIAFFAIWLSTILPPPHTHTHTQKILEWFFSQFNSNWLIRAYMSQWARPVCNMNLDMCKWCKRRVWQHIPAPQHLEEENGKILGLLNHLF